MTIKNLKKRWEKNPWIIGGVLTLHCWSFSAGSVRMTKCCWKRYWTPNCPQCICWEYVHKKHKEAVYGWVGANANTSEAKNAKQNKNIIVFLNKYSLSSLRVIMLIFGEKVIFFLRNKNRKEKWDFAVFNRRSRAKLFLGVNMRCQEVAWWLLSTRQPAYNHL